MNTKQNFCKDSPVWEQIRQTNLRKYGTENWASSEEGRLALSRQVKDQWKRLHDQILQEEPYSLSETISILSKDNYWLEFLGKARNRTLLKNNPRLYRSIYVYTEILEEKMKESGRYASAYNFSHRLRFLVEKGGNIEQLRCKCGQRYSWTGFCRHCSEAKNTFSRLSDENKIKQRAKASQTMRTRIGLEMQKEGKSPRYDLESIEVLNNFGASKGLNLKHAEKGGEIFLQDLGYWLDGYDEVKNVVVEIDEPYHFRKEMVLSEKDIQRHKLIQEKLGCTFYHIYFNKRTNRTVLYNSPEQPDNWNVNNGIELSEVKGLAKNGTKIYYRYGEIKS